VPFGAKMRLLPEQVSAITVYLTRVVEPLKPHKLVEKTLISLVTKSDFVEITKEGENKPLYKRGEITNIFILVLAGKLEVLSGEEKIRTEMGPWSYLGLLSLTSSPNTYRVDYTATLLSSNAQILVITQKDYQDSLLDPEIFSLSTPISTRPSATSSAKLYKDDTFEMGKEEKNVLKEKKPSTPLLNTGT